MTVPVTEKVPGVRMTIACELVDDPVPLDVETPPVLLTCCPALMLTSPSTPATGATSVDWLTARCAVSVLT